MVEPASQRGATFSRPFRGETVAGGPEQIREQRDFVLHDKAFLATPASAKRDHALPLPTFGY
jgi:hypothetical protein